MLVRVCRGEVILKRDEEKIKDTGVHLVGWRSVGERERGLKWVIDSEKGARAFNSGMMKK